MPRPSKRAPATLPSLAVIATRLRRAFGEPAAPPETDPFALIVWESAAYLVDDARRLRVFERLRDAVGIDPDAIASMPTKELADVIRADGGMLPTLRAEKLQRAASLALDIGPDRLRAIANEPEKAARAVLKRFHGFGDPGVDKILMFNGGTRSLAPDSNACRVLLRLGFGTADDDNYTRQYRSVAEAVAPRLPAKPTWLARAHLLFRRHGQTVCRRTAPQCEACPLRDLCAHYQRVRTGLAKVSTAARPGARR